MSKHIEIILPVWNELANLCPLVEALDKATAGLKPHLQFSYLFVDDGSTDGSRVAIDQLCASRDDIRAVHLIHNFGHAAAVRCGLEHAAGDAVVVMDADLQDSPEELPRMLALWLQGAKTVVARGRRQERHRWMFHLFHFVLNRMSPGVPAFGTYCLLDRTVVCRLVELKETTRYFPSLVRYASESIVTVTSDRKARRHGSSRVGLMGLVNLAVTAFMNASDLPVRLASLMGLASSFVALAALVTILTLTTFTNLSIPGWALVTTSLFFASGVQLVCLGIIGEYVSRIYKELRQRPPYFVDQVNEAQPYEYEKAA